MQSLAREEAVLGRAFIIVHRTGMRGASAVKAQVRSFIHPVDIYWAPTTSHPPGADIPKGGGGMHKHIKI